MKADDMEGAVHDKVSHGKGEIGNLWKQDMNKHSHSLYERHSCDVLEMFVI